jgi:Fe-S oxidoreductase
MGNVTEIERGRFLSVQSLNRFDNLIAQCARTLATACPFCLNMMTDGMAGTRGAENVRVLDIAELLLSRQTPG